jgi:hypothetical protein
VNGVRVFSEGDVLGDEAEASAGSSETFIESRLTGELVLETIQIEHEQGVLASSFEERFVPVEFGEILRSALVVEETEEFALGFVARRNLRLRAGPNGKEKKKKDSEKKTELS